ncbi:SufD family Fe-S cluster assembly protein, partial [bacterium]|nr:SufD family Fe-S cluster assembly protein [bacterium]
KHGAYASTNRQKSNLIVIDSSAKASSKPYLYIDENDVEASHASAVGDISEEQLFYLMSRGFDKDLAKRMIILGYFRPVLDRLSDSKIKEQIVNQIKGVIDNV